MSLKIGKKSSLFFVKDWHIKIIRIQEIIFSFLIFIFLIMNSGLLFFSPINQDEFFNLSLVYKFVNNQDLNLFQTFHVHLFSWITKIGSNEIDQIIFLRGTMLLLFFSSCYFLYRIGAKTINRPAALFSVFCFLTFSFVSFHGYSFRTDTISLSFFLISIYLLVWRISVLNSLIAGILMAMSMMLTIKSSVHLVTLVFILISNYYRSKDVCKIRLIFFFVAILGFSYLSFFVAHQNSIIPNISKSKTISHTEQKLNIKIDHFSPSTVYLSLKQTVKRVITTNKLFPEFRFLPLLFSLNYINWFFFIYGFFALLLQQVDFKENNKIRYILLCFCLPLTTLLFYKNAYPYYYVFIMAPGVLTCGIVIKQINEMLNNKIKLLSIICIGMLVVLISLEGSIIYFSRIKQTTYLVQKNFFSNLHRLFPEPVNYIDGSSMASSFHKVGPFMGSSWIESYLNKGTPIFKDIVVHHQPKFVIANIPQLDFKNLLKSDNYSQLLLEDQSVLKNNFIQHWGLIYIAGKKFDFSLEREIKKFEILISGKYTIETNGMVSIDGSSLNTGDVIFLAIGNHYIDTITALDKVYLRWGEKQPRLKKISKIEPLFQGKLL